jgi:sec-independent protein translocase protein TatB
VVSGAFFRFCVSLLDADLASWAMGSLTFSEMATIAIIVLIVFGPQRLPDLARRAGTMVSKVRQATREITGEFRSEYKEAIAPLEEVRDELKVARNEIAGTTREIAGEFRSEYKEAIAPLEEVRDELKAARSELTGVTAGISEELKATRDDPVQPDKEMSAGGPKPVSQRWHQEPAALGPLEDIREELESARADLAAADSDESSPSSVLAGESAAGPGPVPRGSHQESDKLVPLEDIREKLESARADLAAADSDESSPSSIQEGGFTAENAFGSPTEDSDQAEGVGE